MKKNLLYLLAALALVACQPKHDGYTIKGKVNGETSGKVYLQNFRNKMFFDADSTDIKPDGSFEFKGKTEYPQLCALRVDKVPRGYEFFLENAEITAKLSTDLTSSAKLNEVSGSKSDSLYQAYMSNPNSYTIEDLIAQNPKSTAVSYILYRHYSYRLPTDKLEEYANRFDPSIQNGPYLTELRGIIATLKTVEVGSKAPDFSLPDTVGNAVSLSSFKGKYVLIDFWASWCGPCRRENPNVVATYNRFKDKGFTVFGVSLDKDKNSWLKAIEKDGLTWAHVSDLKMWDNEVAALYGVRAIPSNVLINPEGIIIAKNLTGEDLPNKLNEILK